MPSGLIVVVEDDPVVRQFYQEGLGAAGYTVMMAANGEDGLNLLNTHKPRVIILDINLPGIDGIEVCTRAKKQLFGSVPILFVTTNDTLKVLHDCIAAGGDDFLIKGAPLRVILERCAYWSLSSTRTLADRQRTKALQRVKDHMTRSPELEPAKSHFGNGEGSKYEWLSPSINEDVAALVDFVNEARQTKGDQFGRTVKKKLRLLGYVTGAVNARSKTNIAMKLSFNDYLRGVMVGADVLIEEDVGLMLENWHELYDNPTFHQACEDGESDYGAKFDDE